MQFSYPSNQEDFMQVLGVNSLRQKLLNQAISLKISKQFFKLSRQKSLYIYARCNKCSSILKYKLNSQNNRYQLLFFRNMHEHKILKDDAQNIQNYIRSLPSTIQLASIKKIIKLQYSISEAKFYYHWQKVQKQNDKIQNVLKFLDQENYETQYQPFPLTSQQDLPNVLITISKQMKKNFHKYNDLITFDITYNLCKQYQQVREGNLIKKRKWGLGLMLGKNCFNNPIPFAVVLLNLETKQVFQSVWSSFFSIMKDGKNSSIITDQQAALLSSFQSLKQKQVWIGENYIDTFHIIRSFQKKSKNQPLLRYLHEAIFSIQKKQYEYYMNKAKRFIDSENDSHLISEFQSKASKFCICKSNSERFCSPNISTSFHEKTNDWIKSRIKNEKSFAFLLRKVCKLMQQLTQQSQKYKISKFPYQQLFENFDIRTVRFCVSQPIFNILIKVYAKSLKLTYIQHENGVYIFQEQVCKINWIQKRLICSCKMSQKTGLPCIHICKIVVDIKQSLKTYINKRWIIKYQQRHGQNYRHQQKIISERKGRPKNSRRNMIK